ncbi:maleylpyruvate isomerase family mycothiol-dependent enzyme [Nocardioides montaniterrae]
MDWIRLLTDSTDAFATCLDADLAVPVPSCPGWTLADLGEHVRTVHLWAAHAVTERNPQGTSEPLAASELPTGYRAAAAHLIEVLSSTAPDAPAWTFGTEQVAGFWRRRQVHETVIHLYDAFLALGREADWAPPADLAWDGVDEVATLFYPRQVRMERIDPLATSLVITATDVDRTVTIGEAPASVPLVGTAADLYLTLWKRRPAEDPAVAEVLAAAITP